MVEQLSFRVLTNYNYNILPPVCLYDQTVGAEWCMWHLPPINNTPSRPLDLEISKSLLIVSHRNFIAIYNPLPTHYICVLSSQGISEHVYDVITLTVWSMLNPRNRYG